MSESQDETSEPLKNALEEAAMKAYEQHGERPAKSQEVGGSGQDEAGSHSSPSDPPEASTPNGSPDSHI